MKNIFLLIFVAVFLTSCTKDNDNNINNNNEIIIKGKISGLKKDGELLSEAKKIFVIKIHWGTLIYSFVDIVDGSFTYSSETGIVTALVFLDENDQYIGTLSPQGLNLLPLCNLTDGDNTIIDLENLTLVGTSIIPAHDPLGNEIIITEAEINSLKEIDGYFESLAKNIDSDNDGILDVFNNKELYIINRFDVSAAGQWGLNDLEPVINDSALNSLVYALHIQGGDWFSNPNSVVLSGPAGNPYQEYWTLCIEADGNGGFFSIIFAEGGQDSPVPFESGIYTLTIDDNIYTQDYSYIDVERSLLFVIPTLHTNSEGKLVSISLEYELPNGTTINPANILTDVSVQLTDVLDNQFYNTPRLVNNLTEGDDCCVEGLFSYTLNTPLDISELKGTGIGYSDLLGNTYIINWHY